MKKSEKTAISEEMASKLGKLFEQEIRDIYWVEKALLKALPKMAKKATSPDLVTALQDHLTETEEQVSRVERIFGMLNKEPRAKKCEAMEGLLKEAEEVTGEAEEGAMRDAAIIASVQKVEHYEISSYGTLRTFAQTLQLDEAVTILETTLEEEKKADTLLTEVAVSNVNNEAAWEPAE
ncbi:YciE/YciF ferroxidase family protein [Dawidia soli]|uniref:Ferritin-like domain-containing protein n=1 Tax=Dawidia soli TaxID=2782352 RepID=A0AAP2GBF4_9BACT|nr:ferritin-like domain-containing protein [Dawidia soli]MBT1684997.1 ferritin-like domain-containing protein [Dawidia soli]